MGTIIVGIIVFGLIGLAVYRIVKNARSGSSCHGCPGCGSKNKASSKAKTCCSGNNHHHV